MAGNEEWANFPNTETKVKEEQDDDWGDFGGFETALPVTDPQASNTSGLISWATALGTQPSLPEQPSSNSSVPPDTSQANQWPIFQSEPIASQETLEKPVEQVQSRPDLLSPATDGLTLKSDHEKQTEFASDNEKQPDEQQSERSVDSINNTSLQKHTEEAHKAAKEIKNLEEKLSLAEREKYRLKEEFENLLSKHQELEGVSKTAQENLEDQKQKYTKLQEEHQQQLQGIRQAGHDALAIIVQEYKELSKQAVLEEREKSQVELHNFLEEERRKFQEILTKQQESFEKSLTVEREKIDERVKEALQEEQQRHKLEIESALNKERDGFKGVLEIAIKETREQGEESVKAAMAKEKEMHLALMEKMEKTMEEEREKYKCSIKEALDDERQQSKMAIQEAMIEEHKKSKEMVKKCFEDMKSSTNEYIKQKQQMDAQAQRKQYVVMDLFLESARTQLKSLMEDNENS